MRHPIVRFLAIVLCAGCTVTACTAQDSGPDRTPSPVTAATESEPPGPPASTFAAPQPSPTSAGPELQPQVQAVVSSNFQATDAGAAILTAGGSAADAAVAVASVLTVVEPYYSSVLGGDTWALYYDGGTRDVTSLNAVGPVGSKATLEDYTPRAGEYGMHQAILPGAWDGWML